MDFFAITSSEFNKTTSFWTHLKYNFDGFHIIRSANFITYTLLTYTSTENCHDKIIFLKPIYLPKFEHLNNLWNLLQNRKFIEFAHVWLIKDTILRRDLFSTKVLVLKLIWLLLPSSKFSLHLARLGSRAARARFIIWRLLFKFVERQLVLLKLTKGNFNFHKQIRLVTCKK